MYLKPSRLKRVKNGVCCSKECTYKLKSEYSKGDGNHQFGLKGELNSSFKGIEIPNVNNNIIDILVYDPSHPKADKCGRVTKHRKLVEDNYTLFDLNKFEYCVNRYIIKNGYDVHHIDGNHDNNDITNLQLLTRGEHTTIHNNEKIILRDKLGKIIGVIKQDELLENLEADNQQPSLDSNIFEGSTTNIEIPTDKAVDSNDNTSVLPFTNSKSDDIV